MAEQEPGLFQRVQAHLRDAHARGARARGFGFIRARVEAMRPAFLALQAQVRQMKLAALNDPGLVEQAIARLQANGCRVFYAHTAAAARGYILDVCREPGILIKGKSNAVKELGVRPALAAAGVRWVETDLGDWINQLNGTEGRHVIAPAVNFTRQDVAALFSRHAGYPVSDDPADLVAEARKQLRHYLETARYGLTGANAIAADTGTVVLMENEGNIRAVTSLPPVHIVVAGIHKVVPTLEDAIRTVQAASVFGVSQDFGTYCTTLTGPAPAGGFGPREVHVVLVDNGRRAAIERGYAEPFACLNCGSCLDFCPVYAEAGDGYGSKLLGGIGALQESLITGLLDGHGRPTGGAELLGMCLGCTRCIAHCPVGIDTPRLTFRLKQELGRPSRLTRLVLGAVARPGRLRRAAALLRFYQRSSLGRVVRRLGLVPRGLREYAAMAPAVQGLGHWPAVQPATGPERGRVALLLGCIMGAAMGDIHQATARVLRRAGYTVVTPAGQGCCGALHEHAGALDRARAMARDTIAAFAAAGELPVVTNSAGCGAMMKDYGRLLADDPAWAERAARFSRRVVDLTEFLAEVGLGPGAAPGPGDGAPGAGRPPLRVTYQDPCHLAYAQGVVDPPRRLLRALPGVDYVELPATEACCGSAGIYALSGPAQLAVSLALLRSKLADCQAAGAAVVVTANPGCLLHLRYGVRELLGGAGPEVLHVAELLDQVLGGGGE